MSLIADALKTAQREKEQREAREGIAATAVLIPLRESRWRVNPRIALGLLAVGVIAGVATQVVRYRGESASLPLPALAPALISEAIAAGDSAVRRARDDGAARAIAALGDRRAATPPSSPTRSITAPARLPRSGSAPTQEDVSVVLQATRDSAVTSAAAEPRSGELRVDVDARMSTSRLFNQALSAHRAGDLVAARARYERVVASEPDHADALNNLGIILSAQHEYEGAVELLQRATKASPAAAGPWTNLGTALREQGNSAEAIVAFRQALTLRPDHLGARIGLAQQYLAIDALPDARALLERVVAANPAHAEAHYTLGQVLERQGDRAGAIRAYAVFVSTAPPRLAEHAERVRAHMETLAR